jgi:hypothetical protein
VPLVLALTLALHAVIASPAGGASPAAGASAATTPPRAAAAAAAPAESIAAEPAAAEPAAGDGRVFGRGRAGRRPWWREGPESKRKFMIGLAGVIMQAPPIRTDVVYLDPRDIGRSIAMGGVGVFARWRAKPVFGLELDARSGSVRYGRSSDVSVSQDSFLADIAALLYLGRGDVAQFALSGGIGGMASIVRYNGSDDATGRQTWGSVTFRVGAEAEFLFKRLALVLSFRAYGVAAVRDGVRNKGELLDRTAERVLAPTPAFATMLVGSAGIAYRF